MSEVMTNHLDGRFWLSKNEKSFLGRGRVELLEKIGKTGSITKAAKAMKMSYKAAWDSIDAMNNLAEEPLVERSSGGKGGGGTRLTPYALQMMSTYKVLQEEHERFMKNLSLRINKKDGHLRLIERMTMRVSARNQLHGTVIKIHKGAVNSEVVLKLQGNDSLTAIVTNEAIPALDLGIDSEAYALFKAGEVMLSTQLDVAISTSNRYRGQVSRIERGAVNSEVIITLKGGNTLCSMITNADVDELKLGEGMEVLAFFRANSVILGLH